MLEGKFDLFINLDFCMVGIVLYFDIVLLVLIWYEKYDLSSIDMYLFVYFFNLVIGLLWEVCFDWNIFILFFKVVLDLVKKIDFELMKEVVVILFFYDIL